MKREGPPVGAGGSYKTRTLRGPRYVEFIATPRDFPFPTRGVSGWWL